MLKKSSIAVVVLLTVSCLKKQESEEQLSHTPIISADRGIIRTASDSISKEARKDKLPSEPIKEVQEKFEGADIITSEPVKMNNVKKINMMKPAKKTAKTIKTDLQPRTLEEVELLAKKHYETAKQLKKIEYRNALCHINKSIELFKDASSLSLKAEILLKHKEWNDAVNAAERALVQVNEWECGSKDRAKTVICDALDSLNELYPSTLTRVRLDRAEEKYGIKK